MEFLYFSLHNCNNYSFLFCFVLICFNSSKEIDKQMWESEDIHHLNEDGSAMLKLASTFPVPSS